jgi:hypothetical protein
MKTTRIQNLMVVALICALAFTEPVFAQSVRWDELSKLPFKESYPTPETSARLYDELHFQPTKLQQKETTLKTHSH